ncbi:hypothetical protein [Sediminimonas qiaohouensis]|uniref:hypothetical protein n=2 Tax=Sediminimonas TaxID=659427 RepID=UPI00047D5728|nr:hypothetical protein [Sediminimonas qiaohouensis]
MTMHADALLDALEDLLIRERGALLKGDLERLPRLLSEKERLMHALSGLDAASQVRIAQIRPLIARNRSLLDAALRGMRAAIRRIGTRQNARHTLRTYDDTGAHSTIGQVQHRLERRS